MTVHRDEKGTIRLVTQSRRELFNLSALLARGIEPVFLQDKNNPVLVAVHGSYSGGKKIFPDAMRRTLTSSTALSGFRGKKEYDEFWYYARAQQPLEVGFINVAWDYPNDFSKFFRNNGGEDYCFSRTQKMLKMRRFGGITFVHNDMDFAEHKAGIEIFISRYNDIGGFKVPASLKEAFNATNGAEWGRFVRIKITDQRLAASPVFQQALQDICDGGCRNDANYDMAADKKKGCLEFVATTMNFLKVRTSKQAGLGL